MSVMGQLPFSLEEYRSRQDRFLSKYNEDTLVLIPTNPVRIRSNDTSYPYRANSYMLYLCGWKQPEAVFMAFHDSGIWKSCLFVQPRDTRAEIWEGRRVGTEGAASFWPIDEAFSIDDMEQIVQEKISNSNSISTIIGFDKKLDNMIDKCNLEIIDARTILDDLRVIKSDEEIKIMHDAGILASNAHVEGIKKTYAGIGEWEIQSIIEAHFSTNQSCPSYSSIVGGGDNATILHYNSNNMVIDDGDLVLVDAGCEISGYASDITRTWPVNGRFSSEQKDIYQLVLEANSKAIEECKVGNTINEPHMKALTTMVEGLIDLKVLNESVEEIIEQRLYFPFYMHSTSHWLGLDVHDAGNYKDLEDNFTKLEAGMVLTIEPGLYFGDMAQNITKNYKNIGIRIEDDILIDSSGPINLSKDIPKEITKLEK